MQNHFSYRGTRASRLGVALAAFGVLSIGLSCTENLPNGPNTFTGASIKIVVPHDTVIVGDSSAVQAQATDAQGHVVQSLKFNWTSADSTIVGFAAPATTDDGASGRARILVGRRTGRSLVTLALSDSRFDAPSVTRTETAVVGGVRVLTTHDSTLTAVNDTGMAIGAGLVKANGSFVTRASQGIHWVHLGSHVSIVGAGDTIKYIARTNGQDTLIATDDFCLASAKCADTAVVHVSQQLTLTLSARNFLAWSFGDSLGPAVTLADRRGNGLTGTFIRLVPRTPADSAIVKVSGPIGTTNPVNGSMAVPQLIAAANGSARVAVLGIAPDGSVIAVDSVTEVVRQVARRVAVEPIHALETATDSIPVKQIARDARGAAIADAAITSTSVGIPFNNGIWAGPTTIVLFTEGTLTPTLTGLALPQNNPAAPQIPVIVNSSTISLLAADSVVAGVTSFVITTPIFDSLASPAVGKWVRFDGGIGVGIGNTPDSVQVDASGLASVTWTPPNIAGLYTLTGVRGTTAPMSTLADSAGRIVIRRTVRVVADVPSSTTSSVAMSAVSIPTGGTATLTITVKDQFGNIVKSAKPSDVVVSLGSGTLSALTCTLGVCTATYTAPAAAGPDSVSVKILGVEILLSPLVLTIT
ncbi:MAG: invasin domain 3-containing protein [bacterium]